MILDNETKLVTATGFDLGSVRPGPGNPVKMYASGHAADALITITTGVDAAAAEGASVPCTTATCGANGCVEFELPSTTLQFIAADFAVGEINVTLPGNQTNL